MSHGKICYLEIPAITAEALVEDRLTIRWTGAAGARFGSNLVRRRLSEIAPPRQLRRSASTAATSERRGFGQATLTSTLGRRVQCQLIFSSCVWAKNAY